MKKALMRLLATVCACLLTFSASAHAQLYTGEAAFTLTLPDDWISVYEEEDIDLESLLPGEEEALFSFADGMAELCVLHADPLDLEITQDVLLERFTEEAMEAEISGMDQYQKLAYQYDAPTNRAYIAYSYQREGQPVLSYTLRFLCADGMVQTLIGTVSQSDQDALLPVLMSILTSLHIGEVSDDAEG